MKKFLLTLSIVFLISVVGCAKQNNVTTSSPTTEISETTDTTDTTDTTETTATTETTDTTETTAEVPNTTAPPTIQELQKLVPSGYIHVGKDMGKSWDVGFHDIPKICQWDDELGYYVAPDNGTNENGESIIIKVTYNSIDKSELYSTKLNEISNMLESNKDNYSEYKLEYNDNWQALAYYYAIEETITNENGNMVHTVATFELRRYDNGQNANNYSSLIFEVDVLKPEELTENTVSKYFNYLYDSITISYTESA